MKKLLILLLFITPIFANAQVLLDSYYNGSYIVELTPEYQNTNLQGYTFSTQTSYDNATTSNLCLATSVHPSQQFTGNMNLGAITGTKFQDGTPTNPDCTVAGDYYTVWERISDGQDFYAKIYWDGATATTSTSTIEYITEITSVSPAPDSLANATSTNFAVTVNGSISTDDFDDDLKVELRFLQKTGIGQYGNSDYAEGGFFSIDVDTDGLFSVTATSSILNRGWYEGYADINVPRFNIFGFNVFTKKLDSITWVFEVATSTAGEAEQILILLATTGDGTVSASTTAETANFSCNLVGGFEFGSCVGLLFVADRDKLKGHLDDLRQGALAIFPIGYATRFIEILEGSSTTTVKLPAFTATLFQGTGQEEMFTLDMDDLFIGANETVNSIREPIYNKSFQDVFQPWVRLLLGILLIFMIIGDIMKIPDDGDDGSVASMGGSKMAGTTVGGTRATGKVTTGST